MTFGAPNPDTASHGNEGRDIHEIEIAGVTVTPGKSYTFEVGPAGKQAGIESDTITGKVSHITETLDREIVVYVLKREGPAGYAVSVPIKTTHIGKVTLLS
jgi:hypothetical protein